MHCAIYTVRFVLELLCGRRPDAAKFAFSSEEATEYRQLLAWRLMTRIDDSRIEASKLENAVRAIRDFAYTARTTDTVNY